MLLWFLNLSSHDCPTDEVRLYAQLGVRQHGVTHPRNTDTPIDVLVVRSFLGRGLPARAAGLFAGSWAYRGWWGHAKR